MKPMIAILAGAIMLVALACAGDSATPTSESTAVPQATATAVAQATATEVLSATKPVDGTHIEQYMQSSGYQPEWGTPVTGGILKWRVSRNNTDFTPNDSGTTHGLFNMPQYNSLIRFDPWVGFTSIIPDLAKSWEWSSDNLNLTMKLEEGVTFQDNPDVPEFYNGGRVRGDEFTCEDVQASIERHVRPPAVEKITKGPASLWHLNSVTCPDGALGYTAVLNFDLPLAKTMGALAQGLMVMYDKDWLEWYNAEHPAAFLTVSNDSYRLNMGTGAFVPVKFQNDVMAELRRNPDYFREGLPLVDGIDVVILKDFTTAFTALATGQIHVMGRGSWSLTPAQVAQAYRDFPDRIVVYPNLHLFGYGIGLNVLSPPFDNPKVRQAIQLGMDRDDWLLLRQAGPLAGGVIMGSLVSGTTWSHTEAELRTWPGIRDKLTPGGQEDIAEANRLLDEVFGEGNRFTTTCMAAGVEYVAVCLIFIDNMKKYLGIEVNMDTVEPAVGTQKANAGTYDLRSGAVGSNTEIGDPDDYLLRNWSTRYGANSDSVLRDLQGLQLSEPDQMAWIEDQVDLQTNELDPVVRKQIVQALDKMLLLEMAMKIPYGQRVAFPGSVPELKGYSLFDMSLYSNWSIWERLWLSNE